MLLSLTNPSPYFPYKTSKLKPNPIIVSLPQPKPKPKPKPEPKSKLKPETVPKSAIRRISEKLRSLGFIESDPVSTPAPTGPGSAGEIFIPTPHHLPLHRVGHTIDASWSTPENPVPAPGTGIARSGYLWKAERKRVATTRMEVPMAAEILLPPKELKRLRGDGIRLEKRLKVGKAGITEGIINGIHERWRRSELVKIKCEDLCRMNMKRTHQILESKTGGLVIWRSGSIIILYRGANYKYPYFTDGDHTDSKRDNISAEPDLDESFMGQKGKAMSTSSMFPLLQSPDTSKEQEANSLPTSGNPSDKSPSTSPRPSLVIGVGSPNKFRLQLPGEAQIGEEADRLLDGLGPRFTDWWGYEPLPVDADLLPGIVPGFRTPFRLLPFGIKPKLTDREMTILRRLSRPLPCHFALGKNRNLQGLAISMIKLWEKCEVAKIAIKRGVQNTNSERVTEELKKLTGGTLLARDKEFIVFYRGKDFLPPAVSNAIEERRNSEIGRQKKSTNVISTMDTTASSQPSLGRHASINAIQKETKYNENLPIKREVKPANLVVKLVETKLSQAIEKKEKAVKLLAELEKPVEVSVVESDKEGISEEERYMLRKVGLRMKPFLLLGRRGVFAGTVENMHLHWKYRELVKVISKDRSIEHVEIAARTLEAESGGILVAVERVNKGHAIIVYRGKNYRRPATLRPKTLLDKKEAMKRSLEAQRYESLKLHVLSLSRNIEKLEEQMVTGARKADTGDEMNKQDGYVQRDNNSSESAHHQEDIEAEDHSAVHTLQLPEFGRSDTMDEMDDKSESTEGDYDSEESAYHIQNFEEVNEADAKSLYKHACVPVDAEETTNIPQNDIWIAPPEEDEFVEDLDVFLSSKLSDSRSSSKNQTRPTSDEPGFHPDIFLEYQVSDFTTSGISHLLEEETTGLSYGASHRKPDAHLHEDRLKDESELELPFRAAPLSNRERLILRKQALKTRKRPVLAVGQNNIVTGVAKTIKTHFKKYPLAIVNIKGRAEGTSAQEVIFQLEQATGAVLVSREPNKVILYRGWGEGELPGSNLKKDVRKESMGVDVERVSTKLMEAISLECGLSSSRSDNFDL